MSKAIEEQLASMRLSILGLQSKVDELSQALAEATAAIARPDATFDTVRCKTLQVVDRDGKERIFVGTFNTQIHRYMMNTVGIQLIDKQNVVRICASTDDMDNANSCWWDLNGKCRICASTRGWAFDNDGEIRWLDMDGNVRMRTTTLQNGIAGMTWDDKDRKTRIVAQTKRNGDAAMTWYDPDETARISAETNADGNASIVWRARNGKMRINAGTSADGNAGMTWLDGREDDRIRASTNRDGSVTLPTKDRTS